MVKVNSLLTHIISDAFIISNNSGEIHLLKSLSEACHCFVVTAPSARDISPEKQIVMSSGSGVGVGVGVLVGITVFVGTKVGVTVFVGTWVFDTVGVHVNVTTAVGDGVPVDHSSVLFPGSLQTGILPKAPADFSSNVSSYSVFL